jgi:ATP-dependent DNA helicase RecQ
MEDSVTTPTLQRILDAVRRYWGYDSLRPLQEEAIVAGLDGRDSLVVLPTGGGKSLCYQVPPLLAGRTDIVVSPLIALMKDQSDGLRRCGYPAAALHSNMTLAELREAEGQAAAGNVRLLFVAPERLVTPRFMSLLERLNVRTFAIDEAHCISHWGHDFRPEYRQLAILKQRFPKASLHAYTATATPRVRQDIVEQLRLADPAVLIGVFDRPNLTYRVLPKIDVYAQTLEVVQRHKGQAVIVYCISRRDTEQMAEWLVQNKIRAAHYHAGMDADYRRGTQDAFAEDKLEVIVATVAFGMGIDRGDVRCVMHAGLPKSLEHYQQETGRAGRDGLPAECVLLYSVADAMKWEAIIGKSAEEANAPVEVSMAARELLRRMQAFANMAVCRHRAISEHFGQEYPSNGCGACDICLDEAETVPDATVVAQKIISCVARVEERFGAGHVVDVLRGGNTEMIQKCRHAQLSTYGLLKDTDRKALTNLVYQLVDQGLLERTPDEFPVLKLNAASWQVLRGEKQVRLIKPTAAGPKRTKSDVESWEGVDSNLFESVRELRRGLAEKERVPAYIIFGDATLCELARLRPTKLENFSSIRGVGQKKLSDYGAVFTEHIRAYCLGRGIAVDLTGDGTTPRRISRPVSPARRTAFDLFARRASVEEVMKATDRAHSTTTEYLADYIAAECPENIDCWVDAETYRLVAETARRLGTTPLKPIFEALNERIPYDTIRLVAGHLEAAGSEVTTTDESPRPPRQQPHREPRPRQTPTPQQTQGRVR